MSDWQRPGFTTVTPFLLVEGASELVEFLEDAFDAEILSRRDRPDGTLLHSEVRIGESMVIVGESFDEEGPMVAALYLYVEDCDDVFAAALDAGATIAVEPTTERHLGERHCAVTDPAGNVWWIATHLGELDAEEERRRVEALTAAGEEPPEVE
jgi:uncharacterized glyoxalase superfamily protein PhnB